MLKSTDVVNEVRLAESRIRSHIRQTILEHSRYLSQVGGANVYYKLENLQYTGSFKVRGAMNKLLSVMSEELAQGVVTASTGNHGVAVAYSVKELNASGIVFVTENASSTKVQAIERIGADVRYYGKDCAETEVYARRYATQNQMVYVSPYNDLKVIGKTSSPAKPRLRGTARTSTRKPYVFSGRGKQGESGWVELSVHTVINTDVVTELWAGHIWLRKRFCQ